MFSLTSQGGPHRGLTRRAPKLILRREIIGFAIAGWKYGRAPSRRAVRTFVPAAMSEVARPAGLPKKDLTAVTRRGLYPRRFDPIPR